MENNYNNEVSNTNPDKALISSYIIKLLNRNASSKVDRLLKREYEEVKRDPLILDVILRSQLMAFFSKTGSIDLTKKLMKYYREYKLFSALLDAKNVLVICSKEDINLREQPFNSSMEKIVLNLMEKGKGFIVKTHIKSALASCILTDNLSDNFEKLMSGELEGINPEIETLLKDTSLECKNDIKKRIEESKPIQERN